MRTLVQLLIAALVFNGAVRAGMTAWRFHQFKDAVEQEARFLRGTPADLYDRILAIAEEQSIPIASEDVTVERRGDEVTVAAAYVDTVELIPRVYTREQLLDLNLTVRVVRPLTADDVR